MGRALRSLIYTVRCELPDEACREEYLAWLDHHVPEVIRAGALDAEVVRLDGEPPSVAVRYRFASRELFAAYERGPAVALRADGAARFGPERGIRFQRSVGELHLSLP